MAEENINCPCKKIKCVRHGNCDACRENHLNVKKSLPACERTDKKVKKSKTEEISEVQCKHHAARRK